MSKQIIPSFAYVISTDGDSESFKNIKNRLLKVGGNVSSETNSEFTIIASSNDFAIAIHPFKNDLKIDGHFSDGKIKLVVTRVVERTFSLYLLAFVVGISILAYLQKQQPKMILFPIFAFVGVYIYSLLAVHPAHAKIKQLLRNIDEP